MAKLQGLPVPPRYRYRVPVPDNIFTKCTGSGTNFPTLPVHPQFYHSGLSPVRPKSKLLKFTKPFKKKAKSTEESPFLLSKMVECKSNPYTMYTVQCPQKRHHMLVGTLYFQSQQLVCKPRTEIKLSKNQIKNISNINHT